MVDETLPLTWYPDPKLKITNLSLADLFLGPSRPVELKPEFALADPASIMFTAGTTGEPHGVVQTFGNHFYSAVGSAFNLGLVKPELWLCALPLFHISGHQNLVGLVGFVHHIHFLKAVVNLFLPLL